jgi:hypothetical protein
MPIVDLQRNAREIGRIRLGEYVRPGANGKGRPQKLSTYRFTSQSKALMDKVAELYGGTVNEWTPQGGGAKAWEVVTEATRIPVLVPPNPLSQWYELWSGGGCQRRCDGQREVLSDQPCICGPDPDDRECKPHTRLNVMLRDVEGVGVFRLETSGYYAATELPGIAEFLTLAPQEYVSAYLVLEWRRVKREGKTREFAVPGLEIEGLTPAQLMSGEVVTKAALPAAGNTAIESSAPPIPDEDGQLREIESADSIERLRELWKLWKDAGWLSTAVGEAISARVKELAEVAEPETSTADPDDLTEEQEVYYRLLATVPSDWTVPETEADYKKWSEGDDLNKASAEEMQAYIDSLEQGAEA